MRSFLKQLALSLTSNNPVKILISIYCSVIFSGFLVLSLPFSQKIPTGFMDNFFSDLQARGKINKSRDSVRDALYQTDQALNWLNSNLRPVEADFQQKEREINSVKEELFKERKRMIQDAVKR